MLGAGVDAADYASHLVELARTLTRHRSVLPCARNGPSVHARRENRRHAERRSRSPPAVSVGPRATAAMLLGLTVSLASVAAQRFSTFSGTLTDQTNAVLPNVPVGLTNTVTGAKYEVRSDRNGHFEFVGLPDGDYAMVANGAGFRAAEGRRLQSPAAISIRTIQLQVGSLHETIRVTSGPSPWGPPNLDRRAEYRERAQNKRREILEQCAANGGGGPVGGNIKQPTKVVDVKPKYPERLSAAKVGGVLVLEAVIGTDGTVTDVSVVSGRRSGTRRGSDRGRAPVGVQHDVPELHASRRAHEGQRRVRPAQ